jgi:membrane protease YdiL (CAAX protease family)
VYVAFRYTYWRSKTAGVPRVLSTSTPPQQAVFWGVVAGLTCAAVGLLYLQLIERLGVVDLPPSIGGHRSEIGWFLALAVVAAPLFEEFIFRGLIHGGLSRSLPAPLAAVASAALFAIVHPPLSMIPVFGLGLAAAMVHRRTQGLLAPMVAHALYNGIVLGYQVLNL